MAMSDRINVKQWLHDHQLAKYAPMFAKRDICIEELVEFDVKDLQKFAEELGLDTLERNRFVNGIQRLNGNVSKNEQRNDDVDSIQHNYYAETTTLIQQLQSSFGRVDEAITGCKQDVNKKFDALFERLKSTQAKIVKDIDENGKTKKDEIAKQLQEMIDSRLQIQSLEYSQIKQFKAMVASSINYKLNFQYNDAAENQLISSMQLKATGLPPGCVIVIDEGGVTSNSIKVSWAMNSESAVTEYEIEYAKFRKFGASKKSAKIAKKRKSSKKTKKNKKKKKKKKGKHKKYDSDSSSSSSTASSSTTSSSSSEEEESSSSDTESEQDDLGETYDGDEKEREELRLAVIDCKQLSWKSVKFENTEKILRRNCYKLKNLNRGYCYVIRMRCKNDLGWSDWSDVVKVVTQKECRWQYQENEWLWKDFDDEMAKQIQHAFDKGKKRYSFSIAHIGQSYVINFKAMEQTNVRTRKVRRVRMCEK